MGEDPFQGDVRPLRGRQWQGRYRKRVGRYRIIFIPYHDGPRSWDRPLYAFRGGFKGAGASSTDSKIAANIERGF